MCRQTSVRSALLCCFVRLMLNHACGTFVSKCVIIWIAASGALNLLGAAEPAPDSLATRSATESVCPKSAPPAKTLWAVRIQDLSKESEERLPLSCLQGLVNREQPRIFLAYDRFDELWLDWLRERGDVKEIHWAAPKEIYGQFLPIAKGLMVTDPDLPASVNIATMLAAVEGWLPVTQNLSKLMGGVKVALDLRGRWKKNIEAYRWFHSTYGAKMSRQVCANYDPGQFELRDYFVEFWS
ncbi:MAG: GxGYxYP domain-containing protein [Planctomycetota bacterium]